MDDGEGLVPVDEGQVDERCVEAVHQVWRDSSDVMLDVRVAPAIANSNLHDSSP